jgi:hypothetical protein
MERRFFWVGNKEAQNIYEICWHPGKENFADYQSKHHTGAHHRNVHPTWFDPGWVTLGQTLVFLVLNLRLHRLVPNFYGNKGWLALKRHESQEVVIFWLPLKHQLSQ